MSKSRKNKAKMDIMRKIPGDIGSQVKTIANSRDKAVSRRKTFREKPNQIFEFDKEELKKKNYRYLHSNISSFLATYNKCKTEYENFSLGLSLEHEAKQMNNTILDKLLAAESEVAKPFNNKQECLQFFQDMFSGATNKKLEEARTAVLHQAYAADIAKKETKEDSSATTVATWKDAEDIAKPLNDLFKQIDNIFGDKSEELFKAASYGTQFTNLKNSLKKLTDIVNQGGWKVTSNQIGHLEKTIPSFIGYLEEVLKEYALKSSIDNIANQFSAKKVKVSAAGAKGIQNEYVGITEHSTGQGLTDVLLTIDGLKIGFNIKSNQEMYKNYGRNFSTSEIIGEQNWTVFENWANFYQYVFWNGNGLLNWHTREDESIDNQGAELIQIFSSAVQKVNTELLRAAYYLGLPSIIIANGADDKNFTEYSNPSGIEKAAQNYLDNNIKNVFIVLHDKLYWASDIYLKALQDLDETIKDNSRKQLETLGLDRKTMPAKVMQHAYNLKKEFLRKEQYSYNKNQKTVELKKDESYYPQMQQLLENKKVFHFSNIGVWYFLRGSEVGKKKGFAISLKYNIRP